MGLMGNSKLNVMAKLQKIPKEASHRCFQQWQDRWSKCVCALGVGRMRECVHVCAKVLLWRWLGNRCHSPIIYNVIPPFRELFRHPSYFIMSTICISKVNCIQTIEIYLIFFTAVAYFSLISVDIKAWNTCILYLVYGFIRTVKLSVIMKPQDKRSLLMHNPCWFSSLLALKQSPPSETCSCSQMLRKFLIFYITQKFIAIVWNSVSCNF
jgi:hypothetical protein